MAFIEAPTNFYMGRVYNPEQNRMTEDVVYYDSRDLTTHAVVVGMTGSGKTGLCITLLEEAILDNIPAIVIDPKGDITNLALNFPGLTPQEFQPWIQPDDAQRAGMDVPTFAADMSSRWRDGLANWGIVPDRLRWMQGATQISIYTPGSDAGLPISILASLRVPRNLNWQQHSELIRERINGIVTALYALAGMNVDPVKDAEHVLMANIFEHNWRMGRDLTLQDIILQIQDPPFDKLGVFPVDQYMSEKKRYKLAMDLNNIIAAPTFQTWLQGDPMDVQRLLYQDNGRPRVSIFYTAHLNDQERMFITTLILESMIGWMRTQRGTSSLRALLYVDEMFGYFPPYPKNPPTKEPLMRLLKQARAFGVGLVLATQNPGDLDYKGLTNAGTWFIGRLQSDNDRAKVMDGLRQMASADEGLNLKDVEALIADIKPRVFLMRNVHNTGGPIMLHTRWAMSYLAGPLTRQQIGYLMQGQRQQLMARVAQQQYVGQYQQPLQPQGWQQSYNQYPQYGAQSAGGFQNNMPPPPPGATQYPQQGGFMNNMPPPPPGATPYPQQGGFMNNMPPPPPGATPYPQQGGFQTPMPPGATPAPLPNQMGGTGAFNAQSVQGGTGPMQAANGQQNGVINTKPPVTAEISEYFLPVTVAGQQAVTQYNQKKGTSISGVNTTTIAYKPVLIAQCAVRYQQKTASIYTSREYAFHVDDVRLQGLVHWEEHQASVVNARQLASEPFGQALYEQLPDGLTDAKRLKALQKELVDMLYNTARMIIPHHAKFKLYGDPDTDMSEFQAQVYQIAREKRDKEVDKLSDTYGAKMDRLEERLRKKERELDAEKLEIRDRKREQLYTTGEAALSIFRGRTNYTLSRMSRTSRYKRQTEADIQESRDVIGQLERDMLDLEQEYEQKLSEMNDNWAKIANDIEEYTITPYKKDIHVELFGIGWIPHYYINQGGQPLLIPAFA